MIKRFCDRCGKECETLHDVKIPDKKRSLGGATMRIIQLCSFCESEVDDLDNKLVDIMLVLFRDFVKGGENDGGDEKV